MFLAGCCSFGPPPPPHSAACRETFGSLPSVRSVHCYIRWGGLFSYWMYQARQHSGHLGGLIEPTRHMYTQLLRCRLQPTTTRGMSGNTGGRQPTSSWPAAWCGPAPSTRWWCRCWRPARPAGSGPRSAGTVSRCTGTTSTCSPWRPEPSYCRYSLSSQDNLITKTRPSHCCQTLRHSSHIRKFCYSRHDAVLFRNFDA